MIYIINSTGKDCFFYINNKKPYWKKKVVSIVRKNAFQIWEKEVEMSDLFLTIGEIGDILSVSKYEVQDPSFDGRKFVLK